MDLLKIFKKSKDGEGSSKNVPVSKKIGFFSVILLTMGSSIGAGIFFQNQTVITNAAVPGNAGLTIGLAILSWVVASISVVAMGLALLEIVSAQKDDRGIVGWTKIFTHKVIYKSCKNFFIFIYLPINYFIMPYYVLLSFQNALGFNWPWWVWMIVAFFISMWFLFVSGISSKFGSIQNWIITLVKFLPIIFAMIIGFAVLGLPTLSPTNTPSYSHNPVVPGSGQPFNALNPGLGVVLSIPAIFFSFDGFYAAAGVQSQVKDPKKTPMALAIGISITAFVYVMITISILVISSAGPGQGFRPSESIQSNGITQWFYDRNASWVLVAINFFIGFGVLGIINGFAMYAPRLYEDLIKDHEIPFTKRWKNRISSEKSPWVGIWVSFVISVPVFFILSIVGALAFFNSGGYGTGFNLVYIQQLQGQGLSWHTLINPNGKYYNLINYSMNADTTRLLSIVDLMGQWTSLFAFMYIGLSIAGGLLNRKRKTIEVKKYKSFKINGWISSVIVLVGTVFVFIQAFGNLILYALDFNTYVASSGLTAAQQNLTGSISQFVLLWAFVAISLLIVIWDYKNDKKYLDTNINNGYNGNNENKNIIAEKAQKLIKVGQPFVLIDKGFFKK